MDQPASHKPNVSAAELEQRLEWLGGVLRDISHVALSTTNADGSPLCTPVFGAIDRDLNIYWSSHPQSLHSRNLARDPRIFAVIFDSRQGHSALYVQGKARVLEQ